MEDSNVYIKKGKRYEAIGACTPLNWLPDGLWYVSHKSGVYATTSMSYLESMYKVGESKHIDMTEICGMKDLTESVLNSDAMLEILNKPDWCVREVVSTAVAVLVEKAKQEKVSQ